LQAQHSGQTTCMHNCYSTS